MFLSPVNGLPPLAYLRPCFACFFCALHVSSFLQSSSTTSSSSQRTFTSTSSKHPLPARPDWAVGLKAQPTLSPGRRHDENSRTMSPARMGGNLPHIPYNQRNTPQTPSQQAPSPLQATDFPPLSNGSEKKTPVIGGAWTNTSNMRSVLRATPPTSNTNGPSSALVHYPNNQQSPNMPMDAPIRLDEQDHAYERPPPKSNAELFNPKGPRRQPTNGSNTGASTPDKVSGKAEGVVDGLAGSMGELRLAETSSVENAPAVASPPLPAVES